MSFDAAVIGRGLWGTAAAMYLAQAGRTVALIGPSEPLEPAQHNAPFASHHDSGRITRSIDRNPVWARAAARSIARYRALESKSSIPFYTPCGGLIATPDAADAGRIEAVARAEGFATTALSGDALARTHPEFTFANGMQVIADATGGVIDPRAMRHAHETLARFAGAEIIQDHAISLQGGTVRLATGRALSANQILLANGAYAGLSPLAPQPLDMTAFARTVFFAQITGSELDRLASMPTLIWDDFYILPPIPYPDGRYLLKIGGDPEDVVLRSEAEARDWMQGGGAAQVAQLQEDALLRLMPDLQITSKHHGACLLAYSATGLPMIGRLSPHLSVATGCCGAGAKCADELGRVAAEVVMGEDNAVEELGGDLTPRFT